MPVIGISSYKIAFRFLESNDPKTITLLDQSTYLDEPEKPLITVVIPGFTGSVSFSYLPNTIIVIDSDKLNMTFSTDFGSTQDLPDGVYQVTMKVCPYDDLYNKQCYLKTSCFQAQYEEFLRTLPCDSCLDERTLKETIIDIQILIESAKAEANVCNIDKATKKYRAALKKLQNLSKKLNCK